MIERHDYPVTVRWTEATQGVAESSEQLPPLVVAAPPEFGGPAHQWSPEHLFVASVASCFMTTFLAIAGFSRLEVGGLEVEAEGTLLRGEDRRYTITRVRLQPRIGLKEEKDRAKAGRLVEKADAACLISRSIRSEIVVEPTFHLAASHSAVPVS